MIILFLVVSSSLALAQDDSSAIQPCAKNPWYWQYQGKPVVLIGGSDNDNLYQWTGKQLTDHLDLMVSVGGNYVRNTMSDRDQGNIYAFKKLKDGKYDLNQWSDDYRNKLVFFLDETKKRDIIVQLTLWDWFDIRRRSWPHHPWNPKNNINMPVGSVDSRDVFYNSVKDNNKKLLEFQRRYIETLLSITLKYNHVIYNINNESSVGRDWENYWAEFIHRTAGKKGRRVNVTSMQLDPSQAVRLVLSYPKLYSYIDISQNCQDSRGGRGHSHWENIMYWRGMVASQVAGPVPMNNVKIYGSGEGLNYSAGTGKEAEARLWRNIFGGCASGRFHRSEGNWGLGLNERAQLNLRAVRVLLKELDIFSCKPHNDLLFVKTPVRSVIEAYCMANIGSQYAVYFPTGHYAVDIDPWVLAEKLKLKWLDIETGTWSDEQVVPVIWEGDHREWGWRGRVYLKTPGNRACVAFLNVIYN